jgi:hypothetical protein
VTIGARLLSEGEFAHVEREHPFKDGKLFYRFTDASAALKARKLHKMVAHETARHVETSIEDMLADFDPVEAALSTLANLAADPQVQTQLGERVMVSVVPALSAVHALQQPQQRLPMLQLLARCCASEFCWRGLRSAGLLADVLKKDISAREETVVQLVAEMENLKTELSKQRRTTNANRASRGGRDKDAVIQK